MATAKKQVARPIQLITDSKLLTKAIESLALRGKKYDSDLHLALCSALYHQYEYKSTAHTVAILAALPNTARKAAAKLWLDDFGCLMVKENGNLGIDAAKHSSGFNEATVIATPFWEYSKEQAPTAIVAMDLVNNLIKKLSKAKGEGLLDADSLTVLERLSAVVPAVIKTPDLAELVGESEI
jgi:hypothetical protein